MIENNWQRDASCRDEDPNRMQPERATPEQVEEAKEVCIGCPVRERCRQLAESQAAPYGIHDGEWFGADPLPLAVCTWCGEELAEQETGRPRIYCSSRCKDAAKYARMLAALSA